MGHTLQVGQVIFYRPIIRMQSRDDTSLIETTVSKVGRKFFEIAALGGRRFYIDSLMHDGGQYSSCYKVYLYKEDYEAERKRSELYLILINYFRAYNMSKLSISQMEAIIEIIKQ